MSFILFFCRLPAYFSYPLRLLIRWDYSPFLQAYFFTWDLISKWSLYFALKKSVLCLLHIQTLGLLRLVNFTWLPSTMQFYTFESQNSGCKSSSAYLSIKVQVDQFLVIDPKLSKSRKLCTDSCSRISSFSNACKMHLASWYANSSIALSFGHFCRKTSSEK